ncbi:hypothetical protein D9M70_463660 [compost metagenome]
MAFVVVGERPIGRAAEAVGLARGIAGGGVAAADQHVDLRHYGVHQLFPGTWGCLAAADEVAVRGPVATIGGRRPGRAVGPVNRGGVVHRLAAVADVVHPQRHGETLDPLDQRDGGLLLVPGGGTAAELGAHQGRHAVARRYRVIPDVIEAGDVAALFRIGDAIALVQREAGGIQHIVRAGFTAAERCLEVHRPARIARAVGRAGHAGIGMANHQHVGAAFLVGDDRVAASRDARIGLHRDAEQVGLVLCRPGREGGAGGRYAVGHIAGDVDGGEVVELRDIAIPEAGMHQVRLHHLDGEAAVLDQRIGLHHLVVGAADVQVERQHRGHDQQADHRRHHQFDQAQAALAGRRTTAHSGATRTMVVTTRRHRSFTQAELPLYCPTPQATPPGGAEIGAMPCQATVIR